MLVPALGGEFICPAPPRNLSGHPLQREGIEVTGEESFAHYPINNCLTWLAFSFFFSEV